MSIKKPVKTSIDVVLEEFNRTHTNPLNKTIQWIYIPLLTFGLLGVIWSIPFPYLSFLGKYNGFVNWASFLIAFSIYYYYKLSPLLSYGILLLVFASSALIVGLEKAHATQNWPPMGIVCLCILALGLVLQLWGSKDEPVKQSLSVQMKSLLYGPIWLINELFVKLQIKR